jgi:acyl-CoA thioesterase-1
VKNRFNIIVARVFILIMVATMFVGFIQDADAEKAAMLTEKNQPIKVIINGRGIDFVDQNPQVINGRTLVPMRKIFEELGAAISWDDATKTVTAIKGDIVIQLTIGNKKVNVNGVDQVLDVPGTIVNGRTMVPLRFVSEGLKSKVDWDSRTRTVVIVDDKLTSTIETGSFEEEAYKHTWTTDSVNGLPNMLILGDSISIGYTNEVADHLKGKVNVFRAVYPDGQPDNTQDTGKGVRDLEKWLGNTKWHIVHFNFGLHDLKRVTPELGTRSNDPTVPPYTSLENYKKNLKTIVERLKKTGAKLVFATTTPYPAGTIPSRIPEDAVKYNQVAVEVMKENGVIINDFYTIFVDKLDKYQMPLNVHFNPEGRSYMAEIISDVVKEVLSIPK